MHVVLFRAKIRHFDEEYTRVAARMRELAMTGFGCLDFQAVTEGDDEVAISWWPDEASIRDWRRHPEHLEAQRKGRERWYQSWSIEVAEVTRRYEGRGDPDTSAPKNDDR